MPGTMVLNEALLPSTLTVAVVAAGWVAAQVPSAPSVSTGTVAPAVIGNGTGSDTATCPVKLPGAPETVTLITG